MSAVKLQNEAEKNNKKITGWRPDELILSRALFDDHTLKKLIDSFR
jgi:hypothetical protein